MIYGNDEATHAFLLLETDTGFQAGFGNPEPEFTTSSRSLNLGNLL